MLIRRHCAKILPNFCIIMLLRFIYSKGSCKKGLHSVLQLLTMHTNWIELKLPNIDPLKLSWTFLYKKIETGFHLFLSHSLLCDFAFYFNNTICNFILFMHSCSTTKNAATTKVWAHKILNTITYCADACKILFADLNSQWQWK